MDRIFFPMIDKTGRPQASPIAVTNGYTLGADVGSCHAWPYEGSSYLLIARFDNSDGCTQGIIQDSGTAQRTLLFW